MSRSIIFLALLFFTYAEALAFCGFYVAKADAKLFNKSSQVILVRDGDHTVITMSNDFSGDVGDFAMVVPVPEILEEGDIRVVQQHVFDKLDAYTAPRLAEYWDQSPCVREELSSRMKRKSSSMATGSGDNFGGMRKDRDLGVTIEATYTVGEYDILILSAKESSGLQTWLTQNGYKIPSDAGEVLRPYINDKMKFFVVKVNLDLQKQSGYTTLRPLQIQFNSNRFMLPIRLGMANAERHQDLVIYALTRNGRVETSNYRTAQLPTDRDIPQFIKTKGLFGDFYKSLYDKAWKYEGENSILLEYAWDLSARQPVKCDPCPTPPITFAELREAGVWWISAAGMGGYQGDLFITRLHARYSREKYPQDLMFMQTPNRSHYQCRYVIHNPATGYMDCPEGKRYEKQLELRKRREMSELAALTGWSTSKYSWYLGDAGAPEPEQQAVPEPGQIIERTAEMTAPAEPKPETVTESQPEEATETAAAGDPAPSTLPNDPDSVREREAFLQKATMEAAGEAPKQHTLFYIAMAMLACGLAYRFGTKRRKASPPGE